MPQPVVQSFVQMCQTRIEGSLSFEPQVLTSRRLDRNAARTYSISRPTSRLKWLQALTSQASRLQNFQNLTSRHASSRSRVETASCLDTQAYSPEDSRGDSRWMLEDPSRIGLVGWRAQAGLKLSLRLKCQVRLELLTQLKFQTRLISSRRDLRCRLNLSFSRDAKHICNRVLINGTRVQD